MKEEYKNHSYMSQGIDLKRLILCLGKKLWLIIVAIIVGATCGAITYKIVTQITNGQPEFQADSDYYITFNFGEFEHGDDYYNAYTWDSILRDDPIVDHALTLLPDTITKEMILQAVTGEMLGDYRVLTVHVRTESEELTTQIAKAYEQTLPYFATQIDLLTKIEVWSKGETLPVVKNTKTANAAFLGALLAGLLSLFVLLFYYVLEDAFYVEKDVKERFGLPVLGILGKEPNEEQKQILKNNLDFLFGEVPKNKIGNDIENVVAQDEDDIQTWNIEYLPTKEDYDRLRNAKHLLLTVSWGRNNGRKMERLLNLLELQQCKVEGCIIMDANNAFLNAYYGFKK